MSSLIIKANKIYRKHWKYDEETETGSYQMDDISDKAIHFLFEPTEMEDVKLIDIFGILRNNPLLLEVFKRDFAYEYLDYVNKVTPVPYTGQYKPDDIEYLELYPAWDINEDDTGTKVLSGTFSLSFHGMGYVLKNDYSTDGFVIYQKGQRINWSISFIELEKILNFPVKINQKAEIYDYSDVKNTNRITFDKVEFNLAQIIHGILYEISFYGDAASTQIEGNKLRNLKIDLDIQSERSSG